VVARAAPEPLAAVGRVAIAIAIATTRIAITLATRAAPIAIAVRVSDAAPITDATGTRASTPTAAWDPSGKRYAVWTTRTVALAASASTTVAARCSATHAARAETVAAARTVIAARATQSSLVTLVHRTGGPAQRTRIVALEAVRASAPLGLVTKGYLRLEPAMQRDRSGFLAQAHRRGPSERRHSLFGPFRERAVASSR
jgi:hypothetical protein